MIDLVNLRKTYAGSGRGLPDQVVLRDINLSVAAGEITAVVGPSGAGKSTLAQCVNLLQIPTSGQIIVNGRNLSELRGKSLQAARREIGTIFQSDGLLSRKSALQNAALPMLYLGVSAERSYRRAARLLERVGLHDRMDRYPHQLSGGQRQRVGIARALALKPKVLLADEATSGLDPDAAKSIIQLLKEVRDEMNLSIVFITHQMNDVLNIADRVARLDAGTIIEQGKTANVLRDPISVLGRSILPWSRTSHISEAQNYIPYEVTFLNSKVPSNWLERLQAHSGISIDIIEANITQVNGEIVGHVLVGAAPELLKHSGLAKDIGLAINRKSQDRQSERELVQV